MQIILNDQALDFKIEDEKNLGDILSSVDVWLEKASYALVFISIDGIIIDDLNFVEMQKRELSSINTITIKAASVLDLHKDAIGSVLPLYANLEDTMRKLIETPQDSILIKSFEEVKAKIKENYNNYISFISPDELSLLDYSFESLDNFTVLKTKSEREISLKLVQDTEKLLHERLNEMHAPIDELIKAKVFFSNIKEKFLNVSILLQTGKENIAMQNITLLTEFLSKLFRLFVCLKQENTELFNASKAYLDKLTKTFTEINTAFEKKDSILLGDLIEYEVIATLEEFFLKIETLGGQ